MQTQTIQKIVLASVTGGLAMALIVKPLYERYVRKDVPVDPERTPVLAKLRGPVHGSHRGGSRIWPENTMFAFRNSVHWTDAHNIVRRTQILEFDIKKCKDGHLVIMHDENVEATTDGEGLVADLTLEELRSLDAAYKFTPDGGETYPYRGKGHKVPTLKEVLEEFVPVTPLLFYFDFKDASAVEDALEMARKFGILERMICGAVPPEANKELLRVKPPCIPATPDKTTMIIMVFLSASFLLWLYPMRHEIVGVTPYRWGLRILTPQLSQGFHDRKRLVATFGDYLDTEEGQLDCIASGADLLFTDRPDILHGSLEKWRLFARY